ncbi:hypothetical protein COO60DRAFT_1545999 [Scenedesmus sp. NREL 46B-D3]|nr:hypothetical protein COO60DRAFT_1545999 [Scenedesmus sp. NREL 46B-D3]
MDTCLWLSLCMPAAAAAAEDDPAGVQPRMPGCVGDSSSSSSCGCVLQLQLARRCPLHKLAKLVGQRGSKGTLMPARTGAFCAAAAAGVPEGSGEIGAARLGGGNDGTAEAVISKAAAAVAAEARQVADATGVRCAVFTAAGRLAVGLASGHVCLLRFGASSTEPQRLVNQVPHGVAMVSTWTVMSTAWGRSSFCNAIQLFSRV